MPVEKKIVFEEKKKEMSKKKKGRSRKCFEIIFIPTYIFAKKIRNATRDDIKKSVEKKAGDSGERCHKKNEFLLNF